MVQDVVEPWIFLALMILAPGGVILLAIGLRDWVRGDGFTAVFREFWKETTKDADN